jgi:uncharacterized protein
MLVEFSVGNFRSFKDIQTLSMVAAPISSKNKELDEQNTFQATPKLRLLKTKAIYGANGSGKSNLVNAMSSFNDFIIMSIRPDANLHLFFQPFVFSSETENNPSFFQIIFILDGIQYRYGFEANSEHITSEWLFGTPNQREVYYFKREGQQLDINEKHLKGAKKIQNLLGEESQIYKKTSLFISVLSSLNISVANDIVGYLISSYVDTNSYDNITHEVLKRDFATNQFIKGTNNIEAIDLLKFADSGIESVGIASSSEKSENEKIIAFTSKKYNNENSIVEMVALPFFKFASEGTKKVFDIAPFIINSLKDKHPLTIDEFDSKLHPIITKKIVELYNKNENHAQLIFVTHDTNLLDSKLLRRDQIAFIEKDKYGASHLYDLVEFKGVRNDASFEKDYLDGRYGAIPFVGNFEYVFSK